VTTIIAKNQTAGDLALTRLVAPDAKIPASGQAQLTDWNAPYEITIDPELVAYINADQVLLNIDGVDLTKAESLTAAEQKVAGTNIGNLVEVVDVGGSVAGLPALDGSLLTNLAASGAYRLPPNLVLVDPAQPALAGVRYQTWAAADTYVATQTPSSTNRWGIQITGTNSENIVVRPWVVIVGMPEGSTRLTGNLTSTVSFNGTGDPTIGLVRECEIASLAFSAANEWTIFHNCKLTGGTPTGGWCRLDHCRVDGGNYFNMDLMQIYRSIVDGSGGGFPDVVQAHWTRFASNYTLRGGNFNFCEIFIGGTTTYLAGSYTLWNCVSYAALNAASAGHRIRILNTILVGNPTITLNPGDLTTRSVVGDFTVSNTGGNWTNEGDFYDNTASGLAADEVQAAIDEIVAGLPTGDVVGPGSSTTNNVPQFADTSGKLLKDGLTPGGANGLATLNSGSKVPLIQLPASQTPAVDTIPISGSIQPTINAGWLPAASEGNQGAIEIATQTETNTGTDDTRAVTPLKLAGRTATEARAGVAELATQTETNTGTDDTRIVTPLKLAGRTATETRAGIAELATQVETDAGTDDLRIVTPLKLLNWAKRGKVLQVVQDTQVSNVSTTSGSFTPLTSLSQAITIQAGSAVLAFVSMNVSNTANNTHGEAQLRADGTPVGEAFSIMHNSSGSANVSNGAYFYLITGLSAGSRTIDLQWRTSGGSLQLRATSQDDESGVLILVEIAA